MNKIYRRLWSTARQCWVVASELTAPRGKASQTVGAGLLAVGLLTASSAALAAEPIEDEALAIEDSRLLWAMQAAFGARSLSVSSMEPSSIGTLSKVYTQFALTSDDNYRDSTIIGNHLLILGSRSWLSGSQSVAYGNLIVSRGDNNTAIGHGVQITGGGYATGVGAAAVANGIGTTALGNNAKAHTRNSIAVGSGSQTDSGAGISKIAIGGDAYAGTGGWSGAIALGGSARAEYDSVAIGYEAKASATMSVALGRESIATESNTVSVGSAGKERRIVNVKDGAINGTSTDAVNGRQLSSARDLAQRGINDAAAAQRVANGAKSTADQALANTMLVTQTSAASGIRIGGENTGSALTVSNKNGDLRYVNGVRNGTLSATSNDAVTGQQLFATNNTLGTVQSTATAAKATAEQGLNKASSLGLLISGGPTGGMQIGAGNTGSEISVRNKTGGRRSITGLHDAELSEQSTAAVSGRQLFATNNQLAAATARLDAQAPALGNGAVAEGAGANAGTAVGQASKAFNNRSVALGNDARSGVDAAGNKLDAGHGSVALGGGTRSGESATAAGNGAQAVGRQSVAVGAQAKATGLLSTALGYGAQASTGQATALGRESAASGSYSTAVGNLSKATAESAVALGDRAEAGHYRSVALGRQSATTSSDQVSVGNASLNLQRKIVNVKDGAVDAASTEAVTGKQLFATNGKVQANEGVLAGHTSDLAAQSGRIADNRRDLDALRSEFEDFDPDLDGVVKFAADGSVDFAGGKLRGVAAGDISSAASTDAVNGGQLFVTNSRISGLESDARLIALGRETGAEAAQAGDAGVAIGNGAQASLSSEGGTAVGAFSSAMAANSVALGRGALVRESAMLGFALGAGTEVSAEFGAAIGAYAVVGAAGQGSVALGSYSEANEPDVVSIGNSTYRRRIINVDRGRSANEGATVAQVSEVVALLGGGASVDGNGGIIAPTYDVQGGTQNNVGDALAALDSAVVTADSRVDNLEGKLRSAFQDGPSVRADGLNQLVLAGANGSVLTNLADGRIAAGSRDAVTGSQLFEAKQEIDRNRNDLNDLRGERDGLLSRGLMAAEQGNVIDYGGARLTGVADGVVSADSRDVVSGRQLFEVGGRLSEVERQSQFVSVGVDELSERSKAELFGVAIGESAEAGARGKNGATAIGYFSRALAARSIALGASAYVAEVADDGFAVGTGANVFSRKSMAIGTASRVVADLEYSIALGHDSVATESYVVSVGASEFQRRIVNVANGRNATDAATVGQLRGALSTLGGDIDANGNIIHPTFNIQGGQQSTLNEALSSLDSAVVTSGNRVDRVESQLNAVFQNSPTVRNDGLNQLTFAGANGMVLSNVANGVVAAGSRDAVNGGQLHSMQQQLNGRMDGLEHRIDGQPQSRALATVAGDEPSAPTPPASAGDKALADNGNTPKSAPQPQADTPKPESPKPESPKPQVDTAELEKMLARANEYSDGVSREVDRRLDKMDKRFNRMAAMSSAQSAMAMNTAGLATYNRLGAGVGYSEGESAMAVGYQRVLNDKGSATFSLNGAFTNSGERSMGVGVGIGW
ncbi:ESPR-type extended signal peptide-containing protein [Stenotrophomonas maltophilia]|uniref:ESPR-type extended signal peptide-containing protein n=1 Tax=Stenotrophomonas maltophilia TaxID=40324 RepID=UPI0015DD8A03|nr:ESPR-type extended signal peptide-containing protein [Stenotrophomonas maltophilia]MBA0449441.1 autotransporter [Stenotrophomonas maltophilia]